MCLTMCSPAMSVATCWKGNGCPWRKRGSCLLRHEDSQACIADETDATDEAPSLLAAVQLLQKLSKDLEFLLAVQTKGESQAENKVAPQERCVATGCLGPVSGLGGGRRVAVRASNCDTNVNGAFEDGAVMCCDEEVEEEATEESSEVVEDDTDTEAGEAGSELRKCSE